MIDSELEVVETPVEPRSTTPLADVGQRPRKPLRGGARASVSALTDAVIKACQASARGGARSTVSRTPVTRVLTHVVPPESSAGARPSAFTGDGTQTGMTPRTVARSGNVLDTGLALAILLLVTTLGVWFVTVGQHPGRVSEAIADSDRTGSTGSTELSGASTEFQVTAPKYSPEPAMTLAEPTMTVPEPTMALGTLAMTLAKPSESVSEPAVISLENSESTGPDAALTVPDPFDAASDRQDDAQLAGELERLARQNRELDAMVEALEQETMDLEREMLKLDLQIATMSTGGDPVDETSEPEALPHLSIEIDERPGTLAGVVDPVSERPEYAAESGESVTELDASEETSRWPTADDLLADEPFLPDGSPSASVDDYAESSATEDDDVDQASEVDFEAKDPGAARADASALLGLPVERLAVAEVPSGSLAERSSMAPGDLILAIDGLPLTGFDDLPGHHAGVPNEIHDVKILREELHMHVTILGSPLDLTLRTEWVDPESLVE